MTKKNFKTISEVSTELGLEPYILRFWEGHFPQLKPLKINTRRFYREKDINIAKTIKDLLYIQGYTIKGAKRCLGKHGRSGANGFLLAELVQSLESAYKKLVSRIK